MGIICELGSKLLGFPLVTPKILAYITPCQTIAHIWITWSSLNAWHCAATGIGATPPHHANNVHGQCIGILYGYQGIDTDGHEDIQCLGLAFLFLEVAIIMILVFGDLVSGNPQMQLPQRPCSLRQSNRKISNQRRGDLLQSE